MTRSGVQQPSTSALHTGGIHIVEEGKTTYPQRRPRVKWVSSSNSYRLWLPSYIPSCYTWMHATSVLQGDDSECGVSLCLLYARNLGSLQPPASAGRRRASWRRPPPSPGRRRRRAAHSSSRAGEGEPVAHPLTGVHRLDARGSGAAARARAPPRPRGPTDSWRIGRTAESCRQASTRDHPSTQGQDEVLRKVRAPSPRRAVVLGELELDVNIPCHRSTRASAREEAVRERLQVVPGFARPNPWV